MDVGLSVYDIDPHELVDLAVVAEDAGFASLWLGEHVVLPLGYETEHPAAGREDNTSHRRAIVDPNTTLVDPLIALAAVAQATEHLKVATGIYLLPLRHPLAIARMTATLQQVAEGRLMLGVGSGWLEEEFAALGVPFEGRGTRFVETIEVLRRSWEGGAFSHDGPCYRFGTVLVSPTPVEIPLILGGNSERALRRAATIGDGWFSSGNPTFSEAMRLRRRLEELSEEVDRDRPLAITMRMAGQDPALLDQYRQSGFEHVTVWASELWPSEGPIRQRQERFTAAAAALGVHR